MRKHFSNDETNPPVVHKFPAKNGTTENKFASFFSDMSPQCTNQTTADTLMSIEQENSEKLVSAHKPQDLLPAYEFLLNDSPLVDDNFLMD